GQAADRIVILHGEAPPVAFGRLHDAALVQRNAAIGRQVRGNESAAAPGAVAFIEAEILVGRDGLVHFPRPVGTVGAGGGHLHAARIPGGDDVVLAVDLVE